MQVEHQSLSFGFELELTGLSRKETAHMVCDFFDTGQPRQIGGWGYDSYEMFDRSRRVWKIVKDASIRPERKDNTVRIAASDDYKVELVSPILKYEDIPIIQELIRDIREGGGICNSSTGLHIHIGAEMFTPNSLRILFNIIYSKHALLSKALAIHSQRLRYCRELSAEFIQRLNKRKPKKMEQLADIWYSEFNATRNRRNDRYNDSRYRCVNIHQLLSGRLNTVEFRMFNSTLHAGKLKAYIQLSLLIAAQALNQKKATSRITTSVNGNDKYSLRVWLLRLGALSDEFKTMRYHLLKVLHGNTAWRDPPENEELSNRDLIEIGARL